MIVIDTSVLVGFVLDSDAHHLQSVAWYTKWSLRSSVLHAPTLVLVELAGTLSRQGVALPVIEATIAELAARGSNQFHDLDLPLAQYAATVAASAGLKGADAVFVALAAQLGLPMVSWDNQQRERGARFCRTMTPVEAMEV